MRQDLVFSWRELRKQPGLALTAILSLTLGIGATTAVFSVVYSLLVNPYPYLGADRMIELNIVNERGDNRGVGITGPQLKILRETKCIESIAASWGTWNLTTTDEDLPQDVPSTQLTANAGAHFGVPALLGRTLIPSDAPDGQDPQPVVVLSYRFWQRHFNSDPSVVGRNLQLVHKNYAIVGVMPSRLPSRTPTSTCPSNSPTIIGLFSVVSYGVAQRTNEFGIRMALGSTPTGVLGLVFASTAREVIGGLVGGILLSLFLEGVLKKWAENSVQNPIVFAAATLLLVLTSALAAFIPARRASSVDPMVALRYE